MTVLSTYCDQLGRPVDFVDRAYEDGARRTAFRRQKERIAETAKNTLPTTTEETPK